MHLSSLRLRALSRRRRLALAAVFALAASHAFSQEPLAAVAPEIASAAPVPAAVEPDKRIMGVLPNYRTADGTLPFERISTKQKLTIASKDSFDGPNYVIGGIFAGIYQLENSHPGFGQGVAGFARYYGTSYADQVIGNMLTEGFMPVLLHEDLAISARSTVRSLEE